MKTHTGNITGNITYEMRRAWGSKGGKMGKREDKVRAGKIGTAERYKDKQRCPTCLRPIQADRAAQLGIRTVKTVPR